MALTQEEQRRLLEQMLGTVSPAVDPSVVAGAKAGVSRTTQSSLLDPALLLTTGVIDPSALSQALNNYYTSETMAAFDEAVKDWRTETAKLDAKEPQFLSVAFNDIVSGTGLALLDQAGLRDQFDAVGEGQISVDQFTADLSDKLEGVEDQAAVAKLVSDVKQYAGDAAKFRQNKLEFDTKYAGERAALGEAPTFESVAASMNLPALKKEFYKSQDLEGLELLPDPGATYGFSPEEALQLTGLSKADVGPSRKELDALRRMQEEREAASPTVYESLDTRRQAAISELPALTGDPMGRTVSTPGFGRGVERGAMEEMLGGRGSGRTTAASRRRAAGMEAMPQAVGPSRVQGPSAAERALAAQIARREGRSAQIARLLEAELLAAGRTPFGDVLAQQNIYGRATA